MSTVTIKARGNSYLEEYLRLCAQFPLVPIRSEREFRRAGKVLDRLAIIDEDRLTRAQADYLAVLTDLFDAAERRFRAEEIASLEESLSSIDGIDALAYLLTESGMTASDLGRLLGNRQLGAAILRRERQLSKEHIRILADHFSVSTDLFLGRRGQSRAAG